MTTNKITESQIETFALEVLQTLGWEYVHGLAIAPGAEFAERESFEQIILTQRLRKAVARLNPDIPADVQEQAVQKVLRIYSPDVLHNNETFHQFLIEKVKIPYQQDGYERSYEVALIDFSHPSNNEFLVVNQYIIIENNQNKRPDISSMKFQIGERSYEGNILQTMIAAYQEHSQDVDIASIGLTDAVKREKLQQLLASKNPENSYTIKPEDKHLMSMSAGGVNGREVAHTMSRD